MHPMYKRILVTLDGSQLARGAVSHAAALAAGTEAEVTVLEVIEGPDVIRREAEGAFEFTDGDAARIDTLAREMHFNQRERAQADVLAAQAELQAAGVRIVRTAVAEGLAGNEIVDCASREGCEAIVMATRGHGGLGREVVGSVAEYVLRHAGKAAVVLVGPRG